MERGKQFTAIIDDGNLTDGRTDGRTDAGRARGGRMSGKGNVGEARMGRRRWENDEALPATANN